MAAKCLKAAAAAAVDGCRDELQELSGEIWKNPELGFEEVKAHELLTDFLEKKGFAVERSYTGIKTAFRATFGSGRPNVCVICEYDALPEIGHACGHNLIAEAGVATGLGLKAALESKGAPQARVTVLGTPAEECAKGGKVYLIGKGALDDIDFAMAVHPGPDTAITPSLLAFKPVSVTYTGKAAHAAAFPWEGVNALDAAVMAYTSVSVLRQQMKPTWRVHGVITNGGVKPNIIPEKAELYYYIRAPNVTELEELRAKVSACFEAAAVATGCQVDIKQPNGEMTYLDLMSNMPLANFYALALADLKCPYEFNVDISASSDMGSISHVVPTIHPNYHIGAGEVNHTRKFNSITNTPEAHAQTLVAAKAMAYTCIDVVTTDGALQEVKRSFEESMAKCPLNTRALAAGMETSQKCRKYDSNTLENVGKQPTKV